MLPAGELTARPDPDVCAEVHTSWESDWTATLEQGEPPTVKPAYEEGRLNPAPTMVMEAGEFSGQ